MFGIFQFLIEISNQ